MSAVEDIRIKLEQRLNELEGEIESLRSALSALDDEEAAARAAAEAAEPQEPSTARPPRSRRVSARPARPARAARRAKSGNGVARGGTDGSSSAELEQLLAETGGSSAVELARQTGTDYAAVLARIRQLEEAGQTRR